MKSKIIKIENSNKILYLGVNLFNNGDFLSSFFEAIQFATKRFFKRERSKKDLQLCLAFWIDCRD